MSSSHKHDCSSPCLPSVTKKRTRTETSVDDSKAKLIDFLQCPFCREVCNIPVKIGCTFDHIACLRCWLSYRQTQYKIHMCNYKIQYIKKKDYTLQCPLCKKDVDGNFQPIGRSFIFLFEQLFAMDPEFHTQWRDLQLCNCGQHHSKPIDYLTCHMFQFPCPLRINSTDECNIHGSIRYRYVDNKQNLELLNEHLSECKGTTECHLCNDENEVIHNSPFIQDNVETMNLSYLRIHLRLHRSYKQMSDDMCFIGGLLQDQKMEQILLRHTHSILPLLQLLKVQIARYILDPSVTIDKQLADNLDDIIQPLKRNETLQRIEHGLDYESLYNDVNNARLQDESDIITEYIDDFVKNCEPMFVNPSMWGVPLDSFRHYRQIYNHTDETKSQESSSASSSSYIEEQIYGFDADGNEKVESQISSSYSTHDSDNDEDVGENNNWRVVLMAEQNDDE